MNLNELHDIINDIRIQHKSFDFNDMSKEIEEIQFKIYCKQQILENIYKWIKKNPHHTFPKKEKRWLNTIKSHKNLISIKYECDVKDILISIRDNKRNIPYFLEGLRYYIYNDIEYGNECKLLTNNKYLIIYGNEKEAYQNLFDSGILYKQNPYPRIYIRKYSLMKSKFIKIKRQREDDKMDDKFKNNKRKYNLSKPIFNYR